MQDESPSGPSPSGPPSPHLSKSSESRTGSPGWSGEESGEMAPARCIEVARKDSHVSQPVDPVWAAGHKASCPCGSELLGAIDALIQGSALPHGKLEDPNDRTRIWLAKWLVTTVSVFLMGGLVALIVAAFSGTPTNAMSDYLQRAINVLIPLVTLVLGYYFGARRGRARGPQS
jgi:hypothetical protein